MRFTNSMSVTLFFLVFALVFFGERGLCVEASEESGGANPETNQSDREWAKRTTKLNIHENKMKELNKKIQVLINAKNNNTKAVDEKGNPINVLKTIETSFSELKKTVKDYNAERDELKFKYPEEGTRIERRYVPLREQSLEQIEKELSLDGDLTRTKNKIDKKYEPFMGEVDTDPLPPPIRQAPESTLKEIKYNSPGDVDVKSPDRLKVSK